MCESSQRNRLGAQKKERAPVFFASNSQANICVDCADCKLRRSRQVTIGMFFGSSNPSAATPGDSRLQPPSVSRVKPHKCASIARRRPGGEQIKKLVTGYTTLFSFLSYNTNNKRESAPEKIPSSRTNFFCQTFFFTNYRFQKFRGSRIFLAE